MIRKREICCSLIQDLGSWTVFQSLTTATMQTMEWWTSNEKEMNPVQPQFMHLNNWRKWVLFLTRNQVWTLTDGQDTNGVLGMKRCIHLFKNKYPHMTPIQEKNSKLNKENSWILQQNLMKATEDPVSQSN